MERATVKGIGIDENNRPIVILKNNNRILPIWIGNSEASAIGLALENERFERPLTHDLIEMILKGFKIKLLRVEIYKIVGSVFYARMILEKDQDSVGKSIVDIDCRSSDAIAMAIKMNCEIYCDEEIFDKAGQNDTL